MTQFLRVPLVERLRARIDLLTDERDEARAENAMLKRKLASARERRDRWRRRYYEQRARAERWFAFCDADESSVRTLVLAHDRAVTDAARLRQQLAALEDDLQRALSGAALIHARRYVTEAARLEARRRTWRQSKRRERAAA